MCSWRKMRVRKSHCMMVATNGRRFREASSRCSVRWRGPLKYDAVTMGCERPWVWRVLIIRSWKLGTTQADLAGAAARTANTTKTEARSMETSSLECSSGAFKDAKKHGRVARFHTIFYALPRPG